MPFLSAVHSAKPLHILVEESLHTFLSASSHASPSRAQKLGLFTCLKDQKGRRHEPSPLSHTLLSSFTAAGFYWDNQTTDIRHSYLQAEQLVILHRREHLALATFYLCGNPEQPSSEIRPVTVPVCNRLLISNGPPLT